MKIRILKVLLFSLLATSCVSKKSIVYFQNDEIDQSKVSNSYKTIFKPDDLLQIIISAENPELAKPFNLQSVSYSLNSNSSLGSPQQQSYLVDNEGFIDFPVLGRLKIGGLTRIEAIELIKDKLVPDYLKNPSINIKITNFSITVLGDVNNPGTFTVPYERVSVLDAIGLAGDLKISGQRNNIVVYREEYGQKKTYTLNLLSKNTFTSPAYYLQQNDVVYIEPNKATSQSAAYNENAGLYISLTGMIISIVTLLIRIL